MKRFVRLVSISVALLMWLGIAIDSGIPPAALAQSNSWTEITPAAAGPGTRWAYRAVVNQSNRRMIMFAGADNFFKDELNDTWVLSNADGIAGAPAWTELLPPGPLPITRINPGVIYDPVTNKMVIFGGNTRFGFCDNAVNDTWVLDGADGTGVAPQWSQLTPPGGPPAAMSNAIMGFNPDNKRIVVTGGSQVCRPLLFDLWVLKDAVGVGSPSWEQLFPTGDAPTNSDIWNRLAAGVYDQANDRLMVFGATPDPADPGLHLGFGEVWVLENASGESDGSLVTPNWTRLSPTGTAPPTGRPGITYDAANNRALLFGIINVSDTFVLENANGLGGTPAWSTILIVGDPPSGRDGLTNVFIADSSRMTIFGGRIPPTTTIVDEVWTLDVPTIGPDIEVTPPDVVDFGGVNAFTSLDMMVTISNTGGSDLTVSNISLLGDLSFAFDSDPPVGLPAVLAPEDIIFVTINFFPTTVTEIVLEGTLSVTSDDADEPQIDVQLIGNGLQGAVDEQASVLEATVDAVIAVGTLVGSGSGGSAAGRLNAFANMIESAGDLIVAGFIEDACGQLRSALNRIDGETRPPDFATGAAVELITAEIELLLSSLDCG